MTFFKDEGERIELVLLYPFEYYPVYFEIEKVGLNWDQIKLDIEINQEQACCSSTQQGTILTQT